MIPFLLSKVILLTNNLIFSVVKILVLPIVIKTFDFYHYIQRTLFQFIIFFIYGNNILFKFNKVQFLLLSSAYSLLILFPASVVTFT